MPNVYVVNNSGHDFSSAKPFGKLIFMTEERINKFHITKMLRSFDKYLKDSSSEDFILISGPAIMNIMAACRFTHLHGRANLLIWRIEEGGSDRYVVRRFDFNNLNIGRSDT